MNPKDYPFYLIRRPKGRKSSEEVPKKSMDALKNTYGIEFKDMLTNVKACNNGELSPGTNTTIYMGPDRYPPCYFGLAYVDAQAYFLPPISDTDGIKNKDDLPEWIPKGSDMWKPKNWRGDI